jgi:hypothetical protein
MRCHELAPINSLEELFIYLVVKDKKILFNNTSLMFQECIGVTCFIPCKPGRTPAPGACCCSGSDVIDVFA